MEKKFLLAVIILLATLSCSTQKNNPEMYGIIQPINLEEGKSKTIVLSDLFYATDYNIEILPNKNFDIKIDTTSSELIIKAKKNFSGLDLIGFKLGEREYKIPVKLQKRKKYVFKYKSEGSPQTVNLFGIFNSWNRQDLPMRDKDGDGTYEIYIPLDPGSYEYKFFIDGSEVVDPANPVKVPNGLGDYNSVRVIEKTASDNHSLHLINFNQNSDSSIFNFYYESINQDQLIPANVIALADNEAIESEHIILNTNNIKFWFDEEYLQSKKTLRVSINKNGKATNFQTVFLSDGKPVRENKFINWNDAVIYSIMIDRFNDGDKTNSIPVEHPELSPKANYQGGDLQGIIDKLEEGYFDSLGINAFWISPVVDNTNNAYKEYPAPHRYFTGYHGYWPISLTNVEEHFGDMGLLKDFIDLAHDHGIKVLLDYVANHIHEEHPHWNEHRDWFGVLDLPNGRKNLRLWDEQRLTTWFEPYMPSFDYVSSNEALETMTDNAVWWLKESGADGFRHDAVKHVPNEFWRLLTKKIKEQIEIPGKTKVYQVGETFGGYDLISTYVNSGQLDAQFNFNLYDTAIPVFLKQDASFELLDLQMQKTFSVYGVNHLMGNIMDSHDKIRFMAMADGDLEINDGDAIEVGWKNPPQVNYPSSYEKLKLYLAYLVTIPGIPVIYYGDEFGITGAADPDNRRMMRFDDKLNDFEKETFRQVKKIINLRKNHSALRYGDFYSLLADDNCYAYIRSDLNERLLIILNKSFKAQQVEIQIPQYYNITSLNNLLGAKDVQYVDSTLTAVIPSLNYSIIQLQHSN